MAQRALNKVQLIGNLTRDPELRYTPQGTAVCTFGLATNRTWATEAGDKKEAAEFHRLVAWNKLAEICSQLLFKGRRIYIEGRLQTRQWTGKDGVDRQTTEVVISDMIILDSKRTPDELVETVSEEAVSVKETPAATVQPKTEPELVSEEEAKKGSGKTAKKAKNAADDQKKKTKDPKGKDKEKETKDEEKEAEVKPEDIPF